MLRPWLPSLILLLLALVLAGCAAAPFERTEATAELTPRTAAQAGEEAIGEPVIWGGRILQTSHGEAHTELEVIAYPLDRGQRPRVQRATTGRFLVAYPGFLETTDYRAGRRVTISGPVSELREGQVGEQTLTYPVVETEDIHLWPLEAAAQPPRVRLGVGIMLSR